MNTSKKTCLLITLFTMLVSSVVNSEQARRSKLNLQFEESQSVRHVTDKQLRSFNKPFFAAEIYFRSPGRFSLGRGSDIYNAVLRSSLPQDKRHYIASRIAAGSIGSFASEPNGVTVFSLYGKNKEDIKVTAEILINCLNNIVFEKLEKIRNLLENNRNKESELEKGISQLENEEENVTVKLEEMKKMVRYRDAKDAQESIQEFDRVLQLVEIEIIGIQAKLDMIMQQKDKLKTNSNYLKGTAELLFQMRLTQEIELAGALARKNAGESALKKATDFISLVEKTKGIEETLEEKREQLSSIRLKIPRLKKILAEPSMDMRPVELANKVVIYPIEAEN